MPLRACLNPIYNQLDWLFAHVNHEQYTTSISILGGATVGQHVRHILGFLECLVVGATTGMINYERRRRDLTIETDLDSARALFTELEAAIAALPTDRSLHLEVVVGQQSQVTQHLITTLDREIMYLSEHTMHHLAMIRYGAHAQWDALTFPADFGIAESTLRARAVVAG
jgi:hypothetical protein